jgi:hypothetical protein
MLRRREVLALSLCSPLLSSCRGEPEAYKTLRQLGITYSLPRGWTQEDAEDRRAVYMFSSETDIGVAASAMIELPMDRTPSETPWKLQEQSAILKEKYPDYHELRLQSDFKIGANVVGILAYSATKRNVPQTEQYIVFGFGRSQTMLVFTSIVTDVLHQYREAVHGLISSIRVKSP